jgi:5'-3' exonuclease
MGVPKLFHSLIQQYHHNAVTNPTGYYIVQKELGNDLPVHLYFDFNSAIYQVITSEIKTPETLIIHTVQYLETLCDLVPNLEVIYIALDGVPPFGKIKNQRERRFHSIAKHNRNRKITETYGSAIEKEKIKTMKESDSIDTNMITPGTTFMYDLGIAIRKKIIELTKPGCAWHGKRVIFTDSNVPGEGEHKIIHHIREGSRLAIDGTFEERAMYSNPHNTVIYALDNDLIMLALSLNRYCCNENIFLFREASEYGSLGALYADGKAYLFMNITELENALVVNWQDRYGCCKIDSVKGARRRYIDDYIFLGMLLGNDFMPKTHWFSIAEGGFERLLSAYWQVHNHTELFLVNRDTMQIHTEMLSDILYLVKEQEQEAVESLFTKRRKSRIPIKPDMTEKERQQMLVDFYPLQFLQIEQAIEPRRDGWRERYYKICFNLEASSENITMITQSYLKTLTWNFHYYFDKCIGWDWAYPFSYAPCWTDIYNELCKYKNINANVGCARGIFNFGNSKMATNPIEAQKLLVMVLPWASRRFMPIDAVKKIDNKDSPIRVYFPKKYGLNVAFHRYYHECTPIMYKMDLIKVTRFVNNCNLTEDELKRNIVGAVFSI